MGNGVGHNHLKNKKNVTDETAPATEKEKLLLLSTEHAQTLQF